MEFAMSSERLRKLCEEILVSDVNLLGLDPAVISKVSLQLYEIIAVVSPHNFF